MDAAPFEASAEPVEHAPGEWGGEIESGEEEAPQESSAERQAGTEDIPAEPTQPAEGGLELDFSRLRLALATLDSSFRRPADSRTSPPASELSKDEASAQSP
jgi:hypothetical protein